MNRKSGILLHVSSLPGRYGIGNLGKEAEEFAAFLKASGIRLWQILPTTPVSPAFGNSPYSSPSAFAGNLLFISPDRMMEEGLIRDEEASSFRCAPSERCDYEHAASSIETLLHAAWNTFSSDADRFTSMRGDFLKFRTDESGWLDDYALFTVLKKHFGGVCWNEWPAGFRNRKSETLRDFTSDKDHAEAIDFISFSQFLFFRQWNVLHSCCASKGISIVGDIPMFVALDSADVWANQELFDLDENGGPNCVAGVPPDYFSPTGQRWGNPVYRWDRMSADGFSWWTRRIKWALKNFDAVRVDHFRGFSGYWAIPVSETTAVNGEWRHAQGREFFEALSVEMGADDSRPLPFIAEDLGIITDDVRNLMRDFCLPGTKVLLFAFGGNVGANPYAPHNIVCNSVVYTGTHDNNTAFGWWENEATEDDRARFRAYVGYDVQPADVSRQMVLLALSSVAAAAIIPIQDILGLDASCRMNTPGTCTGNWMWRLSADEFIRMTNCDSELVKELKKLNELFGRE